MRQPHIRGNGLIFVISGPSGSGKTTLAEKVFRGKWLKGKLSKSISVTTRQRRRGERQGRDYFFVSKDIFNQLRRRKKVIEWTRYLGNYYATPRDFIEKELRAGRHILLCLDLNGAFSLKRFFPGQTRTIFILPPSAKTLKARIEARAREERAEIRKRLAVARGELKAAARFDHSLVNSDLGVALRSLKTIILAEIKLAKSQGR